MQRLLLYIFIGLFSISLNAQDDEPRESSEPFEDKYLDDIVKRTLTFESQVLPYEALREADIPWSKKMWRIIETREKVNIPFRAPERPFFTILQELISDGKINAFDDDEFKEVLTQEVIDKRLFRVDSIRTYDPDTYEEIVQVVSSEINPDDINRYRVKEIWYFDKEASLLKVRILGISPLQEVFDDLTGELKYELPLFWVYYPELRNFLSTEPVISDYNDSYPMTWYDLFELRYFSSYIIKTTNTLDLKIADKFENSPTEDMDVLLESEKIKEELFNFEQDLWSY
ncbi:MAG: gliding motility protein GldN [Saprospiraceae bacterium]